MPATPEHSHADITRLLKLAGEPGRADGLIPDGDDLIDASAGSGYVYGGTPANPDSGFEMAWDDADDFASGIDVNL